MPTGFTTVSASHLQDATGTPISNAVISFLPVNNNGVPISFRTGGSAEGQTISQAVSTSVSAGAFSIQLADTTLTNPVNVGYRVTVTDLAGHVLLAAGYECIQPSGATWSLDTFVPNIAPQAVIQLGPTGPQGQGFTFRGAWASGTSYNAYDVFTFAGSTWEVITPFTSVSPFSSTLGNLAKFAQGLNFRGAWAASTNYYANNLVTYGGCLYITLADFTSGTTFDGVPTWTLAAQGPTGQGFNFRNAWAASTAYAPYDVVTQGGQTYLATTSFTSGATFNSANWSLLAAAGMQPTWMGTWNSASTYGANQSVFYSGVTYISTGAVPANQVPSSSSAYWQTLFTAPTIATTPGLASTTSGTAGSTGQASDAGHTHPLPTALVATTTTGGATVTGGLNADSLKLPGTFDITTPKDYTTSGPGIAFAIVDKNNRACLIVHTDGTIAVSGTLSGGLIPSTLTLTGAVVQSMTTPGGTSPAYAITDANGRSAFHINPDGSTHIASLALSTLALTNATTASTTAPGGSPVAMAFTDANGIPSAWIEMDGSFHVAGSLVTKATGVVGPTRSGGCVDSEGWRYYSAQDAHGYWQIYQARNGIVNQLTLGAANSWAPILSADEVRINFMTDRVQPGATSYAVTEYRMTIGGCEQVPSSTDVYSWLQNDIVYLGVNGQSLSGAANSGPAVTTTAYGKNVSLNGGPANLATYTLVANPTTLVPLLESTIVAGTGYGQGAETPCSAMANQFAYLCQRYRGYLPTVASQTGGAGGHTLAQLFEPTAAGAYGTGSGAYAAQTYTQTQLAAAKNAATLIGRNLRLMGFGFIHGESDAQGNNTGYAAELIADYPTWMQSLASVGGPTTPPLFITQTSTEYEYASLSQNVISPQQLAVCISNPGRFFFAGPEYPQQANYSSAAPHLASLGYQWLGMLLGAAMFRALVLRQRSTGLYPSRAVHLGTNIYVKMNVPPPIGSNAAPTLVIDTTSLAAATLTGGMYGFEVRNSAGTIVPISGVTLVPDHFGNLTIVQITCSSDPGTGGKVGYANTFQAGTTGTFNALGPWGNLRDADTTPALYSNAQGSQLWNWCAHFNLSYTS